MSNSQTQISDMSPIDIVNDPRFSDVKLVLSYRLSDNVPTQVTDDDNNDDEYTIYASKAYLYVCENLATRFTRWANGETTIIKLNNMIDENVLSKGVMIDLVKMIYGKNMDYEKFISAFEPSREFFDQTITYIFSMWSLGGFYQLGGFVSKVIDNLISKFNIGFGEVSECCNQINQLLMNDDEMLENIEQRELIKKILTKFVGEMIFGKSISKLFFGSERSQKSIEWICDYMVLHNFNMEDPFIVNGLVGIVGNNNRKSLSFYIRKCADSQGNDKVECGKKLKDLQNELNNASDNVFTDLCSDIGIPKVDREQFMMVTLPNYGNGFNGTVDVDQFMFKVIDCSLESYLTNNIDVFMAISASEQAERDRINTQTNHQNNNDGDDSDDSDDDSESSSEESSSEE